MKGKKEEIWLIPMTKAPTPTEKFKKHRDNTKTQPKLRLHNDCGPTSDGQLGVTIATQPVLLNRFTGSQPFH